MKQQVIEDVNIMPQLDKACGLDMHKDKIVGFISGKDGSNQEFREFGTYTCELRHNITIYTNVANSVPIYDLTC
jgi:transposase